MNLLNSCSIVIVTYNSAATIGPCLASVLATIRPVDSVVVVDNSSRDNTVGIVRTLAAALPTANLDLIINPKNRGFSIATNQGAMAHSSNYVVLLNPDTIVPPLWLTRLSAHFHSPEIGAVGPVSNYAHGRQSVVCHWRGSVPDEGLSPELAANLLYGWNRGQGEDTKLLIGFCLMLRRDLIHRLGCLDERLFLGNDDLELSWRLRLHGLRLRIATDVFIYHEGQHSFLTEPPETTGQLVQESSDGLYRILETHYRPGRVPTPEELWGINWFHPSHGTFNHEVLWHQTLQLPIAYAGSGQNKLPLVSIIILTYNQQRYTEECVSSIEKNTTEPYEIIFVDNASTDGTVPWLKLQAAVNPSYRLISNSENHGFAAGCNQGLIAAKGDYFVLLNNDVVVTQGWLAGLFECLQAEPGIGIVGPVTNNASGIQMLGSAPYTNNVELEQFAQNFRCHNKYRRIRSRRLVGFCMLFARQLYNEIGGLDEQFGIGNYEDDDFCLRASVAGYQNFVAGDVYLHHYGSVSFKAVGIDYRKSIVRNGRLFQEKWSRPVESPELAERIAKCRLREDAESLLFGERADTALTQLTAAYREYSGDRQIQKLMGYSLVAGGRYEEALSVFPKNSPMWLTLAAYVAMMQGTTDEAERLLASAINADPGLGEAYLLRGALALKRGEPEYAAVLMIKGLQLAPAMPWQIGMLTWMCDSDWTVSLLAEVEHAILYYPQSRSLARLMVYCRSSVGIAEKTLGAAELFIQNYSIDERALAEGLKARRSIGPWAKPHATGRLISLCMIVKDEEHTIARCLASCRPLAGEIIVVDTGSTDRTVLVAELMGAQVLHHIWQDDFSAARNASLAAATGDWILVMDADEVLSEQDYQAFRQIMADYGGRLAAFTMETRNYTNTPSLETWRPNDGFYQEEAGVGWTPSSKIRLWSNVPTVRFANPIHELVEDSAKESGLELLYCAIPVHHYGGLDSMRAGAKDALYYRLGLKKLEQGGGDDARALYELAVQAGAMERFVEAGELLKRVVEKEPGNYLAWFNLGYALLRSVRFEESIAASLQAVRLKPDLHEAVVNYAIAEICGGDPFRALHAVESLEKHAPLSFAGQLVLAVASLSAAQPGRCREIFQSLTQQKVELSVFVDSMIEMLCKAGRHKFCRQLLELIAAEGMNPGNVECLTALLEQPQAQ